MEVLFQNVNVKNHSINIDLPSNFDANQVDVIISPRFQEPFYIPNWQKEEVQRRTEAYLKDSSLGQDFYEAMESKK